MTEFLNSSYKIAYGEVFDITANENLCLTSNVVAEKVDVLFLFKQR